MQPMVMAMPSAIKSPVSQLLYVVSNRCPISVAPAKRQPQIMVTIENIAAQRFFLHFLPKEKEMRIGKGKNIKKCTILSVGTPKI